MPGDYFRQTGLGPVSALDVKVVDTCPNLYLRGSFELALPWSAEEIEIGFFIFCVCIPPMIARVLKPGESEVLVLSKSLFLLCVVFVLDSFHITFLVDLLMRCQNAGQNFFCR